MYSIYNDHLLIAKDINIETHSTQSTPPCSTRLKFLSLVDTSQIPLHMVLDGERQVAIECRQSYDWFHSTLISSQDQLADLSTLQYLRLGILCAVDTVGQNQRPRPTEILFYALPEDKLNAQTQISPVGQRSGSPLGNHFYAIVLSSDLSYDPDDHTQHSVTATWAPEGTTLQEPIRGGCFSPEVQPTHARSAIDALHSAAVRRKRGRRVEPAKVDSVPPVLPQGYNSLDDTWAAASKDYLASTSARIATVEKTTLEVSSGIATQSAVSTHHLQGHDCRPSIDGADTSIANNNKDTISRIILAGMRLYGYSQSKSGRSIRSDSEHREEHERTEHEEFKLLYHQIYRSICFAFRTHIRQRALQAHTNLIREMVDEFLALYTVDPLDRLFDPSALQSKPSNQLDVGSATSSVATTRLPP